MIRILPRLFAISTLLSMGTSLIMAQGQGSFRLVTIDGKGNPLPNTIIEVFTLRSDEAAYSGRTDSAGLIRIAGIPEGRYLLEMKAMRLRGQWINPLKIQGGIETDLGYWTIGPEEDFCSKPGNDCLISFDPSNPSPTQSEWECAKGIKVLRGDENQPILLEFDELKRRAITKAEPQWPEGSWPGRAYTVRIVIGIDGRVLCANAVRREEDRIEKALTSTAHKWLFQPILYDGKPIAAHGLLEFEAPHSYPPEPTGK